MRWRIVLIALLVAFAFASVGTAALPDATCSLPGTVPCLSDAQCTQYGAVCDVPVGACVCSPTDGGVDLAGVDLAGADLSSGGGGGGGGGGAGGSSGGTLPPGGGMTGPPKTGGCSFVPGTR